MSTFITPAQLADVTLDAAIHLQDNLVAGNLCLRNVEQQFASHIGDEVTVKVPADLGTADELVTTASNTAITQTSTKMKLEKHFYKKIPLTAKEKSLQVVDFEMEVVLPAVLAVATSVERYLLERWTGFFNRTLSGTAGTSPSTVAHLLAARKALFDARVPMGNMVAIIDSTAEQALLQVAQFTSADYGADRPLALREAALGKMHKTAFFVTQGALSTFNRGDVAGTVLVNGGSQSGTSLVIDGLTAATGTIYRGTRLTINAISNYTAVVAEDATIAGNAATLTLVTALPSSPADNAAITFGTAPTKNIVYNPMAALGAIVAPAPFATDYSKVQKVGGLSMRVSIIPDASTLGDALIVDTFAAAGVRHPNHGAVWQG